MQPLADELGVSRVTLFRQVGGREELLSQALWRTTEHLLRLATRRAESDHVPGTLRSPGVGRHLNALVAGSTALHRLLADEPALAIRVLTDPRGRVQTGVVAFVERLLLRDRDELGWEPVVEPGALAYALVRLGESFLYADVLASRTPDLRLADRLQAALILGVGPVDVSASKLVGGDPLSRLLSQHGPEQQQRGDERGEGEAGGGEESRPGAGKKVTGRAGDGLDRDDDSQLDGAT